MSIGNELKTVREGHGLNRKEVAEILQIPYTTLSNYENDSREPSSDFLKAFAKQFNVTIDSLLGISTNYLSTDENNFIKKYRTLDEYGKNAIAALMDVEYERVQAELANNIVDFSEIIERSKEQYDKKLRIFGKASAGLGVEAIEEYEYIYGPERADFALIVDGDSMEPKFHHNQVIYVHQTPTIANNQIGVVQVQTTNDFIPRVYLKKINIKNNQATLISLNHHYEEMTVSCEDITILGTIVY